MNKASHVYRKTDGWYLHSSSQTTDGVWIDSPPYLKLPADSTAVALGEAVIQVVEASTSPVPHPTTWNDLDFPLLELAGAKSWKAFEKDAKSCGLQMEGGQLLMIPSRSLGPNQGFEPIVQERVDVSFDSTAEQIGVALRTAFLSCE